MLNQLPLLTFGFLLAFCSSFGQTFFIALFGADVRAGFGLSHSAFGQLYSLATLASGLTMIWLGAALDRIPLRRYSVLALLGLAAACVAMASANTAAVLVLALFGLRLAGQGMLSHAAVTGMAKSFSVQRGKAISIATLGHPAGEALLPALAVLCIAAFGWREVWLGCALALLALLAPIFWLADPRPATGPVPRSPAVPVPRTAAVDYTRRDVLRDRRFYLLLPALLAPGFLITGIFFHQAYLVEVKGWTLAWFAQCFIGFALASTAGTLLAGPLVDRLGAVRLMPFYLLPLGLACLVLGLSVDPGVALAFMLLAGITLGAAQPVVTAMWAEVYGVAHLGAIRALAATVMVFSTALAPGLFGMLFDAGVSFETLLQVAAAYVAVAVGLVTLNLPALSRDIVTA